MAKHVKATLPEGDEKHWLTSKNGHKMSARKAISAGETKKRFKANTVKVKTTGKKTHKTAKIKM